MGELARMLQECRGLRASEEQVETFVTTPQGTGSSAEERMHSLVDFLGALTALLPEARAKNLQERCAVSKVALNLCEQASNLPNVADVGDPAIEERREVVQAVWLAWQKWEEDGKMSDTWLVQPLEAPSVRNSRIEAAARALEQEAHALLPFAGGCGTGTSWKAGLATDTAWPDLEAKAQQTLFTTSGQSQMATIEQLHAWVFATLNLYKSLARAEGQKLGRIVVKMASEALQEAAVTVCEIPFFEVLAAGV